MIEVKRFKLRIIIDLLMLVSLFLTLIFGLLLKFAFSKPHFQNRAFDNVFLGFHKSLCCELHFVFSLVFALTLLFHLIINWKTLKCYFSKL